MSGDLTTDPDLPPEPDGKLKFILIALGPIPIGLLIAAGSSHADSPETIKATMLLISVLTLLGSIIGCIGLAGGLSKEARPKASVAGFFQGVLLFFVEIIIIFFAGCAIILSQH